MDIASLFELGGTVVWILAAMSVLALTITLVKLMQFARMGVWRQDERSALELWQSGQPDKAQDALQQSAGVVAIVVATAMKTLPKGESLAREESARVGAEILSSMRSLFRPMELIATLSPLLGLLGTVIGMIEAFQALQAADNQVDPAVLSGGIWEALLTTAVGLTVAIPTMLALNWMERTVERTHHRIQDAATRVFTQRP